MKNEKDNIVNNENMNIDIDVDEEKNENMNIDKIVMTANNLADIIEWLKNGNCVCIYSFLTSRFFYKQPNIDKIEGIIIYIDVNSHPGLLDNGEWDFYILQQNYELKKIPTFSKEYFLALGY